MPGRGHRGVQWASLAVTALVTLGLLADSSLRPLALFSAALLAFQLVQFRSERRPLVLSTPPPSPGWSAIDGLLERVSSPEPGSTASTIYRQGGHADIAVLVARAAARLGEYTTAMAWLQTAAIASDHPDTVVASLVEHPDFAGVRAHTAFGALHLVLTT